MKTFPILYKKTSTGKIQQWEVIVNCNNNGVPVITTRFGQVDGKIQETEELIKDGKNIGKANETSPYDQACAQALAQWTKQLKKGYVESIDDAVAGKTDDIIEGGIFPTLAHVYAKQGHKIKFPAMAQPKLDGHRCTSQYDEGVVTMWSRTRKPIKTIPHIVHALENCGLADRFDGELYNHDYHDNFEDLTKLITPDEPVDGHEIIQYHVYDLALPNLTNYDRYLILESWRSKFENTPIHIVETIIVNDEDELMDAFDSFIKQGYEGCMVRNMDGMYKYKRSYDLQKIKEFDEDEFKVIDVKISTKGKMAGKAMFVFELPDGKTFDAKMKGKLDDLTQYADNPELAIGRMVTVQFQGYTKYDIPRFPVAVRFRVDL